MNVRVSILILDIIPSPLELGLRIPMTFIYYTYLLYHFILQRLKWRVKQTRVENSDLHYWGERRATLDTHKVWDAVLKCRH